MTRPALNLTVAVLAVAVLAGCGDRAPSDADWETFEVDFAAVPKRGPVMSLDGQDAEKAIRPAGREARVSLPSGEERQRVSVDLKFGLTGDFEAEGAFRSLQLPEVRKGHGNGVVLAISRETGRYTILSVSRVRMPQPGMSKVPDVWKIVRRENKSDGALEHEHLFFPTSAESGRLKLVREGGTVRCLAAEGADGPFQELTAMEFGPEPVGRVAFAVDTGGPTDQPTAATFTRLSVAAASLPVGPPPEPEQNALDPTWIAGGVAVLAFAAAGVAVWRRRLNA